MTVLAAIALTPSAPLLVPELSGAAAEVVPLREAAIAAAAVLPDQWIAVGVGPAGETYTATRGSFAGYGADVGVALCPRANGPLVAMPLCALITGWLRGQVNPGAFVTVRVYAADLDAQAAVACGRTLRAEIDGDARPIGVLVVADGANTLTEAAPGGFDPGAEAGQSALDDALSVGDPAALVRLAGGAVGRVAYQVLAGLAEPGPAASRELARGAPYGVGYFVGVWEYPPSGSPSR